MAEVRPPKAVSFFVRLARATGMEIPSEIIGAGTIAVVTHLLRVGRRNPAPGTGGGSNENQGKLAAAIARITDADQRTAAREDVKTYPATWRGHLAAMRDRDLDQILALNPQERKETLSAVLPPAPPTWQDRLKAAGEKVVWIEPYLEEGGRLAEEEMRQKEQRLAGQRRIVKLCLVTGLVVAIVLVLIKSCGN